MSEHNVIILLFRKNIILLYLKLILDSSKSKFWNLILFIFANNLRLIVYTV